MLVKYRKDYEKIAMGLLSYLPDLRNLKNLQEEMSLYAVSYTHLRAHETVLDLVCRLLLEKKKK